MANQCTGVGSCHLSDSKTKANTEMTKVVMAVIQKDKVRVGKGMVVLRSICVPNAHVLAATKAKTTPRGLPERLTNSCQSKRMTPSAAAATPPHARLESWF